jgi:hypothetical protein
MEPFPVLAEVCSQDLQDNFQQIKLDIRELI